MIISHAHKYLFVELPQTGTTAISRELRENYGGEKILHKHATYELFLQSATPEEKTYFVFSCIRNPLDNAVSSYFKIKNDHHGFDSQISQSNLFTRFFYSDRIRRFDYIHRDNADFASYFLKFYHLPYDNWSILSHAKFNFIIRFESMAEDFATALQLIGLEPKRTLPMANKTEERSHHFVDYYNTPEVRARAMRIFGPYMERWEYKFPEEWGTYQISLLAQLELRFYNTLREIFWKYLRPHIYMRIFQDLKRDHVAARIRQAMQWGTSRR